MKHDQQADPGLAGKRVLVLGAGYVGGALAVHLQSCGAGVQALTRNEQTAAALRATGIETVLADLASADWHARVRPPEVVVNCVSSGGGGLEGYRHSYLQGMRSVSDWLRRRPGVRTLIYTGSTSVYPQREGIVDESTEVVASTDTAAVLLETEEEVARIVRAGGVERGTVLRLAGIYGPGRHALLDHLRANAGPLPGCGDHRLNLVYRDDIVSAVVAAVYSTIPGLRVLNVADGAPAKKCEVVDWLAARLGIPFPGFTGQTVPGRRNVIPDRTIRADRIRRELGWIPAYADFRAGYTAILGA